MTSGDCRDRFPTTMWNELLVAKDPNDPEQVLETLHLTDEDIHAVEQREKELRRVGQLLALDAQPMHFRGVVAIDMGAGGEDAPLNRRLPVRVAGASSNGIMEKPSLLGSVGSK